MPRSDQSQMAILGALSIMPMTGYRLREEIRDTLGHFWSESFGQIYPALTELELNGLIERRESTGTRANEYDLTESGLARLRQLLAESPQMTKPRNGVMLRLFFGAQLGPEACKLLIVGARERAEVALAELGAARAEVSSDSNLAPVAPYVLLTISAGEHSARSTIAWANEALTELSKIAGVVPD